MRLFSLSLISIQLVALAFLFSNSGHADAVSLWPSYFTGAKNYLVGLTKDGLISKLMMVKSFNETLAIISERYEMAKQNGEIEGKDESEVSAIYYKIIIEEVRNLRARIEKDKSGKLAREVVGLNVEELKNEAREELNACKNHIECDISEQTILTDPKLDDEEEAELLNQLEDIENLDEQDEMGWALNEETRTALKLQTRRLLADLVANELKQLGSAILTGYVFEGPIGPFAAVLGGSIKYKIVQYLINCVVDMMSNIIGKPIEVTSYNELNKMPIGNIQAKEPLNITPATIVAPQKALETVVIPNTNTVAK